MGENDYNINVYVHEAGDSGTSDRGKQEFPNREQRKGQAESNTFARIRTKRTTNGVDLLGNIKAKIGDNAYDKVIANGGSATSASRAKVGAMMGVLAITETAKSVGRLAISNVGEFTSNSANQNAVDNIGMAAGNITSAGFSIAAGAAMGGWIGALVALALNTAKTALDVAQKSIEYDKQTKIEEAQTQRTRDRLGYIETGYSR